MGLSKEGAVPSVADRTSHFENDTTFAELMEADDDASAADYLARSVALSGGIAVASVKRCTTTSISNLDNHLIANRAKINEKQISKMGRKSKVTKKVVGAPTTSRAR